MIRILYTVILALIGFSYSYAQTTSINSVARIANGLNFDVDVANGKIYLISSSYYELDLDGNTLYTNSNINDIGQGVFDFGPSIEVGPDGIVHVIHRTGGDRSNGFNISYSKKETSDLWSVNSHQITTPMPRNYVVDVVGMDEGKALAAHAAKTTDDVWGSVFFFSLDGSTVDQLGDFGSSSYYRSDSDFRMEKFQNQLHLATGKPNPYGFVYYMNAGITSSLPTDLASNPDELDGVGENRRRGQPDLKIDQSGNVFISYGDFESVFFDRYSFDGLTEIHDKRILTDLGEWHLDLGMSALGVSEEGDTILVVGLETGGDPEIASSCALHYTYSLDGGESWTSPGVIPDLRTNSAEGRSRPRIHHYGNKFYVFYNNVNGGIAMSTIQVGDGSPPDPPEVELVDPVDLSLPELTGGMNFDVEVANDRIYIISDHYYEYNLEGEKYAENILVNDIGQDMYDFCPALSLGSGGEVHVITRNGGSRSSGFNLAYSKKLPDGSWAVEENTVGVPVERNYAVDVVALEGGGAVYAHGSRKTSDGFGTLSFYNLNGTGINPYGDLGGNYLYKDNSDFRMEQYQNTLYLASGKPDGEGTVYYMEGSIGASLTNNLSSGIITMDTGDSLSGQPDLRIDQTGNVFLTYGSDNTVLFNRYSGSGSDNVENKTIFDKLGNWKLNLGLSAIGISTDGETLLAVGLKTDGSVSASNCSLYYTYSLDGGDHWIYPLEIPGFITSGGEGRMRPRVRFYEGRFYIFFNNNSGGIAVKTIDLRNISPGKSATPVVLPLNDTVSAFEGISIESSGADAIYYSLTDNGPDMLSIWYEDPFTIDADCTIHAIAYRRGYLPSDVLTVTKTLKRDIPPDDPDLVDPVDLSLDTLCKGTNFDVEIANDKIYLIADHYYEFDLAGTIIDENMAVEDLAQTTLDFGPSIAVGSMGDVHVITRHSGSASEGFRLNYSAKNTSNKWSVINFQVGLPMPGNNVIDVLALENEEALFAHAALTSGEEEGSVHFYNLSDTDVIELGDFGRHDLYSRNSEFRMERYQNQIHLASGKPDNDGVVYYMQAAQSSYLPLSLAANPIELKAGEGRRGRPDLRIDQTGNVFITYGSAQSVHFNSFSVDGLDDVSDLLIVNRLGNWQLDLGLSAIASTPGGDTLLAVALETDGSAEASTCKILYTYSFDGGQNWVYPITIEGKTSNAGEGRMRPRVKFYRDRFYIFYNNTKGGIAVKTMYLRNRELTQTSPPLILPEKDLIYSYEPVSIAAHESDVIYYSFTDSDPDLFSTYYDSPFKLDHDQIIFARAYRGGYLPSDVVWSAKYVTITFVEGEQPGEVSLSIYPVPVNNLLQLESFSDFTGKISIKVFNHAGQIVYVELVEKSALMIKHRIDVSEWSAGVYIIELQGGPVPFSKKFVIQ